MMFYEDSKSKDCGWLICVSIEIGIGLILIGLVMFSIGIVFFLDRGLLAIGNVSESFLPLFLSTFYNSWPS
jgi:hypothetical protein